MDPKQLALAHFEKGVLAVFAGWLLMSLVGLASPPDDQSKKAELDQWIQAIQAHMGKATVPEAKDPGWNERLEAQLDAAQVPQAGTFPAWVMHRRPGMVYYVPDNTPKYNTKHLPPVDVTADASTRGQVVVRWKPSLENEYVTCKFEVQRKKGEAGEWETVHTAGPGETEWADLKTSSRTKYFYRVVSLATADVENPVVSKFGLTVPEDEARRESMEAGPVETQLEVYVLPITINPATMERKIKEPDAQVEAYVRVYKWDAAGGKFENYAFTIKGQSPIGGKVKLRGGREFDFTTGASLDDCWFDTRKHKLGHDEKLQVIRIRFADGSTMEFNDKDKPEEVQ